MEFMFHDGESGAYSTYDEDELDLDELEDDFDYDTYGDDDWFDYDDEED